MIALYNHRLVINNGAHMDEFKNTPQTVIDQAQRELDEENFRAAVERYKEYLRYKRSFWVRIFPWRIHIERRTPPKKPKPRYKDTVLGAGMVIREYT